MPRKNLHRCVLLAFLILLGMIVSPVLAYYTPMDIQTADGGFCFPDLYGQGEKCVDNTGITQHDFKNTWAVNYQNSSNVISVINIYQKLGTTVNFTIYYGAGSSVTGSSAYTSIIPGYSHREITLGSSYASQDFIDVNPVRNDRYIISYASNKTDAGELISQGFMIHNPAIVGQNILGYYPVTNFQGDLMTGIDISADNQVDVYIWADNAENTQKLAEFTSVSILDNATQWVNFALGIAGALFGFVVLIFSILKFFFIDNLLLVVLLYFSVSMAYSAISTKNIFQFYKKFFGFQRSMLGFMVELWNYLIQIISAFRGIFRI